MSNEALPDTSVQAKSSNAYEVAVTPGRSRLIWTISIVGVVLAVVAAFMSNGPTLWGFSPSSSMPYWRSLEWTSSSPLSSR